MASFPPEPDDEGDDIEDETMTSAAWDDTLGKLAYDAYCMQRGDQETPWDGLKGGEQDAWVAAARAVEATTRNRIETYAA